MKSYTDIEQSKKLAELLPLESADTIWDLTNPDLPIIRAIPYEDSDYNNKYLNIIPCWSLASLLNILNTIEGWYPGIDAQVGEELNWQICMFSYETGSDLRTAAANKELVDTCYEVILKLYENKIL